MWGLIGERFDILVAAGFGLFACVLGYVSITNNLRRG